MLKNRSFWTGLGAGLILGSVMLQSVFAVQQLERQPAETPSPQKIAGQLTVPELKEVALQKGFVLYSKEESLFTKAQLEDAKVKAVEEARVKWTAEAPKNLPDGGNETAAKKKGIYIKQGLDAFTVAARLQEFGIIADGNQFVESLAQQKLNTKIQFGYFEFEPGASLQDVINTVTTVQ